MTDILIRRGKAHRDTHREEGHVKTGAEIGVIKLQTKECQGLPEPPKVRKKQEGFRVSVALLTSCFRTSSVQSCERINFYSFKPSSLW